MFTALIALLGLGYGAPPVAHQEKVFLGVVASRPIAWIGKQVEMCGDLRKVSADGRTVYILSDKNSASVWAIYVSPKLAGDRPLGRHCLSGLWQRYDGMSREQVEARGWDIELADGINPEYLLAPSMP